MHSEQLAETITNFQKGETQPREYVDILCNRANAADEKLRSLVSEKDRRERLYKEIERIHKRFPDTGNRPALFGVPVGVKDIIHVDNIETRAGSALPPELFAEPEAECITSLRDNGAVIFGKTVTTEFAGGGPGLTRNPHNLDHTPGGSSSGSAAAVAAGFCPLALGTQTVGSIIRPAAFCGVVGLKPSYNRVPTKGVIERSQSADHIGMFTQDISGMEISASVLCKDWKHNQATQDDLPTIGTPQRGYIKEHTSKAMRDNYQSNLNSLKEHGCEIKDVEINEFKKYEDIRDRHRRLTKAELAIKHQEWFENYEAFYRTTMARRITEGLNLEVENIAQGRNSQYHLRENLNELFEEENIDLLVTPAAPGSAPKSIQDTGSPIMNVPWTHSGLPAISLPSGKGKNNLPLGLQFVAPYMNDEHLIGYIKNIYEPVTNELKNPNG